MRDIKYIVVHCSDTPNGRHHTVVDIRRWHVVERGWSDIGYNAIVRVDGSFEWGRDVDKDGDYFEEIGAHVRGHNTHSLGICLIGRDNFTHAQLETLGITIQQWKVRFPNAEVIGHRDLDPGKTCPNFDAKEWWKTWESSTKQRSEPLPPVSWLSRIVTLILDLIRSRKQP